MESSQAKQLASSVASPLEKQAKRGTMHHSASLQTTNLPQCLEGQTRRAENRTTNSLQRARGKRSKYSPAGLFALGGGEGLLALLYYPNTRVIPLYPPPYGHTSPRTSSFSSTALDFFLLTAQVVLSEVEALRLLGSRVPCHLFSYPCLGFPTQQNSTNLLTPVRVSMYVAS